MCQLLTKEYNNTLWNNVYNKQSRTVFCNELWNFLLVQIISQKLNLHYRIFFLILDRSPDKYKNNELWMSRIAPAQPAPQTFISMLRASLLTCWHVYLFIYLFGANQKEHSSVRCCKRNVRSMQIWVSISFT